MQLDRKHISMMAGAAGGGLAVGIMYLLSLETEFPLASIPFATSIVLMTGSPEAAPARPRALVGGHVLSALVGVAAFKLAGPEAWVAALAVGVAMLVMLVSDSFHPPAGISPLIIVMNGMSWSFILVPVAAGALILLAYSWVWTNYVRRQRWPDRWW
ncbi:HPP family protein [Pseudorhodoplanes sinuspersici]|uniref:HPP family protein n=2 Tax=Pseudorhodoplanes sinuspersici TaxID=1235591 RepID=A0A1W6ZRM1_9HYPH|nr:HPP family protein [Pseudorhodoplanes sinuspersici]